MSLNYSSTVSKLNIDLSNLDLSNLDLSNLDLSNLGDLGLGDLGLGDLGLGDLGLGGGGGGKGGAHGGGGIAGRNSLHKYDGVDSLNLGVKEGISVCADSINDRYGVGKHFVRGFRDAGNAIFSGADNILSILFGGLTHPLAQFLKALLCAIENGFSDFGSDFDSATDIAKHGLVNFFKLQGPSPILGIPVGIGGIAAEAAKAATSIVGDAFDGVGSAASQAVGGFLR